MVYLQIWKYNLTSKVASRLRSDVHQPMGLDFYNNTVYYSSQTQETISALDTLKNTSKVIKNNLENIGAVKIFQAGRPQGLFTKKIETIYVPLTVTVM